MKNVKQRYIIEKESTDEESFVNNYQEGSVLNPFDIGNE